MRKLVLVAALLASTSANAQSWNWRHDPYFGVPPVLRPFVYVEPNEPLIIEGPAGDDARAVDKVLRDIAECKPVRLSGDDYSVVHPASECDTKHPFK